MTCQSVLGAARPAGIGYIRAMARLTLRLDFGPGQAVGHGKIQLLEAVRDHGSISAAGRSMGMSYRRAWLLVEALNALFEQPVITTKHGGQGGGGAELTPFGGRVVQQYHRDREEGAGGGRRRPRLSRRGDGQTGAGPLKL